MSKTGKCITTTNNGQTKKKNDRFSGIQRENIVRSIIDLLLRDYLCIISVCRSSLPVPPTPSSDYSIGIGAQRGGTYSS